MEARFESTQPLEELLLADVETHSQLERRTRRNWLILVATSLLSTMGLTFAVAPLVHDGLRTLWPWAYTNHALLAGLSLLITALAWYLTEQERRVISLRLQLLDSRRRELKHCKNYGRAVARANAEMHREIEQRKYAEQELRQLNETLEERVAQRSEEARRHAEALGNAKKSLEEQNHRLRELYSTAHQFVDNVSHEFRTPLTVIREYTTAINEGLVGETTPEQREYLETISNRVEDLHVLVEDLLDISRIEADLLRTTRRSCSVEEIMRRVRPTLERKALGSQIRLEVTTEPELERVYCDPEKVGRVLLNLGVNAIKFSDPEGVVQLWARPSRDGKEIEVGVTDKGPGIPPDSLEIIFERFRQLDGPVRSSMKGFGLGLNIVKELVQLNFGHLNVESELDQGSTFSFTIPLDEPRIFLPLYLQRVQLMRGKLTHVSLLTAQTEDADATAQRAIQGFLEDNIRRTDLLFPSWPSKWLLVAATRDAKTQQLIDRMQRSHAEASSARSLSALPALHWNLEGCWRLADEGDALMPRFLALHQPVSVEDAIRPAPDASERASR